VCQWPKISRSALSGDLFHEAIAFTEVFRNDMVKQGLFVEATTGATVDDLQASGQDLLLNAQLEEYRRNNPRQSISTSEPVNIDSAELSKYHELLANEGVDPLTGGPTSIGKFKRGAGRRRSEAGSGLSSASGYEGTPTRGSDFPRSVRARAQATHRAIQGIRETAVGSSLPADASLESVGSFLLDLLSKKVPAPTPELGRLVEDAGIPVIGGEALDELKQLTEGTTSKVYVNRRTGAAYKLVAVTDGKARGFIPGNMRIVPSTDTIAVEGDRTHPVVQLLDAIDLSNRHGSPVFTEVAAVTEEGDLVLKQPYVEGIVDTEPFSDPADYAAALRELNLQQVSTIGGSAAISRVGNDWVLFDDLHGANVVRDGEGRAALVDSLASRVLTAAEAAMVLPFAKSLDNGSLLPEHLTVGEMDSLHEASPQLFPPTSPTRDYAPLQSVNESGDGVSNSSYENTKQIGFIYINGRDAAAQGRGPKSLGLVVEDAGESNDAGRSQSTREANEQRTRGFERLVSYADRLGMRMPAAFFKRLANANTEFAAPGAEHSVYHDPRTDRVIKITHADYVGDGTVGAKGGALDYFTSLLLGRAVFNMQTEFEGIVQLDGVVPQVVTSQPMVRGRKATLAEIADDLENRGFTRVEANQDVNLWEHKEAGVKIYDAVPSNVLRSDDGVLHYIDVDVIPTRPVQDILNDLRYDNESGGLASNETSATLETPQGIRLFAQELDADLGLVTTTGGDKRAARSNTDAKVFSATPEQAAKTSQVGSAWKDIASKENAFSFGRVSPDTKSVEGILTELDPAWRSKLSVEDYSGDPDVDMKLSFTTANGGQVDVFSEGESNRIRVGSESAKGEGSLIYQAAYAWAHNNGYVVTPDLGLSPVAELRKTSHMLSSALRFGTTEHLLPSPEQKLEGWKEGNSEEASQWNTGLLARRETQLVFERFPWLSGLSFNENSPAQNTRGFDSRVDSQVDRGGGRKGTPPRGADSPVQNAAGLHGPSESQIRAVAHAGDGVAGGVGFSVPTGSLGTALSNATLRSREGGTLQPGSGAMARAFASLTASLTGGNYSKGAGTTTIIRAALTASMEKGVSPEQLVEAWSRNPDPFYAGALYSNETSGFNPTVFTSDSRAESAAFARAKMASPELRRALEGKVYIAYQEQETLDQARSYIRDKFDDDFFKAAAAADTDHELPPEQRVMVKAVALKLSYFAEAALARQINMDADLGKARTDLELYRQKIMQESDRIAENLADMASRAGSELRVFRMVADLFAPRHWVRLYKTPFQKRYKDGMLNTPLIKLLERGIKQATEQARRDTVGRMQKVIERAGAKFLPKDITAEERREYVLRQRLAHLVQSPLPMREQIARAATEAAAVGAVNRIRQVLSGAKVEESLITRITADVTRIAGEQIEALIEARLGTPSPEMTVEENLAAAREKIDSAWRDLGKLPLAEQVFNSAVASVFAYAPKEAGVLTNARFDAARSALIQKAVSHTVVLSDAIRQSLGQRGLTVEALKAKLREANPDLDPEFRAQSPEPADGAEPLSESNYDKMARAVEAVYNDLVSKASQETLDRMIQQDVDRRFIENKLDRTTIQRLLPYINMGGFQREDAYAVLAEKFQLPTWDKATVAEIERQAEELQALPEGSTSRDEAAQQLGLYILKAHIKSAGGWDKVHNILDISGAIWTAGVLSGPPTQIVNATATGISVFMESLVQATAYAVDAKRTGASTSQSMGFFKDAARAWSFAFGSNSYGTRRWVQEAEAALTKGTTRFKSEKQENLSVLEALKYDGNFLGSPSQFAKNVFSWTKYIGRAMLAADGVNSMIADNAKRMMALRALAIESGKTEAEVEAVISGPNKGDLAEAERILAGEEGNFKTKLDRERRKEQILEGFINDRMGADRASKIKEAGRDFAAYASFNGDAYGLVGFVATEVFGRLNQALGLPAKIIMPFPRTTSNLLNASLNYTPWGYLRAFNASPSQALKGKFEDYRKTIDRTTREGRIEFYAMNARASAGTAAIALLVAMAMAAWRERKEGKTPFIEVVGKGPKDFAENSQWRAAGNKPFHVRIRDVQIRYTDIPGLSLVLGAIGTAYDEAIHSDTEGFSLITAAGFSVFETTLDRNMLSGANELFKAISGGSTEAQKDSSRRRLISSMASGFTQPQLVRWLGQMATGKMNESRSTEGWLIGMTPLTWFRDKPILNVLGEPIDAKRFDTALGRFGSPVREHPILTPLTDANVFLPQPQKFSIIDTKTGKPRPLTDAEFYRYSEEFGKALKEQLQTPGQIDSLLEISRTSPEQLDDAVSALGSYARGAARMKLGITPAPR